MNGSRFGLIEVLLVFGLVGLWCWNELRVVRRDSEVADRRDAARRAGETSPGTTEVPDDSGEPPAGR